MTNLLIRAARAEDLDALVALFADDPLGGHGDSSEAELRPLYRAAFERCAASPAEDIFVAEEDGVVVGTFHLSFTNTLTSRGAIKARIEAVQVRADRRGRRFGEAMVKRAMELAREAGAESLSLTSNARRLDAHRFYERLGFSKTHAGFKISL
ncbi:GNAT family N-acetyltransferase [Consotaella salsifontis]|uniref:Predicted N-acetyltransferase YhbS n=1 Tax=Consotaella salsifontis TaxID=1365950 RepID=A0A1T4N1R9_9HYPH|nr:GNAT family N-acetyltransferase [Consotaella salsifontis]SJZ73152.1 Predicted N-acetyltransferase YhbS [Consotaella salsifontis]